MNVAGTVREPSLSARQGCFVVLQAVEAYLGDGAEQGDRERLGRVEGLCHEQVPWDCGL